MSDLSSYRSIHIVGIGGAGMSAIARVLKARGFAVRGSDRSEGRLVAALREEGIPVCVGHAPENVGDADLVLISSAVPAENPEVQYAHQQGIPVMQRPAFLPLLTDGYDVVAVAGAHGKTTAAGMLATVLLAAGLDPTYIVGGIVNNLETNARVGTGNLFVIEADEYRNTFLSLNPAIAVITNIEYDHPDVFPCVDDLCKAFSCFVGQIRKDGTLIACGDDAAAREIGGAFGAQGGHLTLYGSDASEDLDWRVDKVRPNSLGGVDFKIWCGDTAKGTVHLQIPGAHNALNALAVLAVATELGVAFDAAAKALESFKGTARRFEVLGEAQGVVVVDDYAHHPTQIKAVLSMARQRYPGRRVVAVWQPHTFSRIKALREDFLEAFGEADRVLVLPIYAAREVDDGTVTHRELAAALKHASVAAAASLQDAAQLLAADITSGDVVLLMGAGDEYQVGEALLTLLQ